MKEVDKNLELKEGLNAQILDTGTKIDELEVGSEEWLNAIKGQQILSSTKNEIEKNEEEISDKKKNRVFNKVQLGVMAGLQIAFLLKDSIKDLLVLSFEETGYLRSSLSKTRSQIPDFISKMKNPK